MLAAPTQHIYDLTTPRATHLKYETYQDSLIKECANMIFLFLNAYLQTSLISGFMCFDFLKYISPQIFIYFTCRVVNKIKALIVFRVAREH